MYILLMNKEAFQDIPLMMIRKYGKPITLTTSSKSSQRPWF